MTELTPAVGRAPALRPRNRKPSPNRIQPKHVAMGAVVRKRPGRRVVFVELDEDTVQVLRGRAIKEGTSLSEQLRTVIEWGMENFDA